MWGADGRLLSVLLLGAAAEMVLCNSEDCIKRIKGENITLVPNVTGSLSEIIWKKGVDKVAEWDSVSGFKAFSHLKNRAAINSGTGSLTIWNISQIDAGEYKAEPLVAGSYQFMSLCLEIFEPPSPPNLTCTIEDDGIYVNCTSVWDELTLSYHWDYINMNDISHRKSTKEMSNSSVKLPKNTDLSGSITCIIVASKSTVNNSIRLSTCDSRGAVPQKRSRILTGCYVAVTIIFLVLVVAVLVVLQKRKDNERPPGEAIHSCEGKPEDQCVPIREGADIPEGHQAEKSPFLGGHGNELPQPSNREVNPESHTNENRPCEGLLFDPERKSTSSSEDIAERHQAEATPFLEGVPENELPQTSNSEALSEKPPEEPTPLHEAGLELETLKTSSTEDVTTPES